MNFEMMMLNAVSVVIPTLGYNDNLRAAILSLTKTSVSEIIVVSRTTINLSSFCSDTRVKLLVAPEAGVSEARNLGISRSSNDIIAFTDDDCTVPPDWPLHGLELLQEPKVDVVGGPGVTDPADDLLSKCAGAALSTPFGTSSSVYRYSIMSDHPQVAGEGQLSSCNLLLRKSVLKDVGYFDTILKTCEENELIERIRSVGHIILYAPRCIVFHHRRPLFRPFLKQISGYAKGRATYSLRWPRHLRPVCVAPSVLVFLTVMLPILSIFSPRFASPMAAILGIYLPIVGCGAVRSTLNNSLKLRFAPLVFLGIVTMHYCYGVSFLVGLTDAVARMKARELSLLI